MRQSKFLSVLFCIQALSLVAAMSGVAQERGASEEGNFVLSLPVTPEYDPSATPLSKEEKQSFLSIYIPLMKFCASKLHEADPYSGKPVIEGDDHRIDLQCDAWLRSRFAESKEESLHNAAKLDQRETLAMENGILVPMLQLTLDKTVPAYETVAKKFVADCEAFAASLTSSGNWDEKIGRALELQDMGWALGYADLILEEAAEHNNGKELYEKLGDLFGSVFDWRDKITGTLLRAYDQANPSQNASSEESSSDLSGAAAPEHRYATPVRVLQFQIPKFGPYARQYGIHGYVIVHFVVSKIGSVTGAEVVKTDFKDRDEKPVTQFLELEYRALNAVRQSRFRPATREGRPVEKGMRMRVEFVLSSS